MFAVFSSATSAANGINVFLKKRPSENSNQLHTVTTKALTLLKVHHFGTLHVLLLCPSSPHLLQLYLRDSEFGVPKSLTDRILFFDGLSLLCPVVGGVDEVSVTESGIPLIKF